MAPSILMLQAVSQASLASTHAFAPELDRDLFWKKQSKDNKEHVALTRFVGMYALGSSIALWYADKHIKDDKTRRAVETAMGVGNIIAAAECEHAARTANLDRTMATVMAVSSVALGALSLKSGLRDVFNKKN